MSGQSFTQNELKEVLSYDPATGIFRWKVAKHGGSGNKPIPAGTIAGGVDKYGYRKIFLFGRTYRAHRLAWFYVYGVWPHGEVDHKKGDRDDNRIAKLREANKQNNQANSKLRASNQTGFKGVGSPLRGRSKYPARITVNYKTIWLGSFDTPDAAHAAYVAAAAIYFGEFARAS